MRAPVTAAATILFLAVTPAALATTETAQAGNVTATFTFQGTFPNYDGQNLEITQGATVFYDEPVASKFCGTLCTPYMGITGKSAVDVFSFDPGTMTYVKTERNFGDPQARIVEERHNGRYEFLTADDSFAYQFTDFAASGLPIEVESFSDRRFTDVTRRYPRLVAKDAAFWLRAFERMASDNYQDSVGVIAAWAADEDLLGHVKLVNTYLAQQAAAGHLNGAFTPGGARFIASLQKFLRRRGYLR